MATCRNSLSPGSSVGSSETLIGGPCGLGSIYRLLRRLDVPYYENFVPESSPPVDQDGNLSSRVSVRKSISKTPRDSIGTTKRGDLTGTYLEICILKHPSLKGHPYLPELLAVTLINSPGGYNISLITGTVHGTLEDLFNVERKVSKDPRPYLISWAEREDIVLQCAEGLAALHDCNILHNNVQPSCFTVYITHPSPENRSINVKISSFTSAVLITTIRSTDEILPANGEWSSIGPLASCVSSPFCRDIHSFGLMVMYLSYYEFMGVEECMEFLKTQRGFYDELGIHPLLDKALSLFHVVSRCCISHDAQAISMHWVAPIIKP
jgi:hypothetical protein